MTFDAGILKGICPSSKNDTEKAVYSTDSSCIKGNALAVIWPENAEQLQKVMRYALREKFNLTIRGGGTSLVGGAVPQDSVVLDMSRFNKIKRIDLREKAAYIEAGVVLDDINKALASYNLEFPVKPGSHSACTLGGMIATNAGGMLSPKFGKVEDWIEGIRIMDGTGKVFDLFGQQAKTFAGTEGCCGIILEARIRLNEMSAHYSTDFYEFEDIAKLMLKVNELKQDKEVISIEYINSLAARLAGFKEKEYLLVKYSGMKGNLDANEAEALWKLRENIYSILLEAGYKRIEDPYFEKDIDKFIDWLKKQNIPCFGHIAYGVLHPHLENDEQVQKMNDAVKELGGQFVGEHGVGMLKKNNAPLSITHKIKELKEKHDPNHVLNRGKVI